MAILTYQDLQTEWQAYLGRSDAVMLARFPTFMQAAEQRIFYGFGEEDDPLHSEPLRAQAMETTATITITTGTGTLPADYLEQRALTIPGFQTQPNFEPPQRFFGETQAYGWSTPVSYTVTGTTLTVAGAWNGALSLVYYRQFPALTPAANTHALLAAFPLVWLHALLLEASEFARNDGEATRYIAKLRADIDGINEVNSDQRYGGPSQMTMRIDPIG